MDLQLRLVLSFTLAAILVSPAGAIGGEGGSDISVHKDADDVRGPLDIKASMIADKRGEPVLVAANMQEGEELDLAALSRPNMLLFDFDTDRDGRWDRAVGVAFVDGELKGVLIKNVRGEPTVLRSATATTKFGAIQASFPKRALGYTGTRRIKWSVTTNYTNDAGCSDTCVDYAPSKTGWYNHRV